MKELDRNTITKQTHRLYTFTNVYLSSIQKGIQSAHLVHELMNLAYQNRTTVSSDCDMTTQKVDLNLKALLTLEWAEIDKTMIVCNGGNSAMLQELICFLEDCNVQYPWTYFKEDEDSLNSALTVVGIVLPEDIFDAKFIPNALDGKNAYQTSIDLDVYYEGSTMFDFIHRVKSARLAI